MNKYLIIALLAVTIIACQQKPAPKQEQEQAPITNAADQKLLGFWVGSFIADKYKDNADFVQNNKLNIAIKSIIGDSVFAQSIVAGNSRPLKGKVIRNNGELRFELSEPGTAKYDGKFSIRVVKDTLKGHWESFDKSIAVTRRVFDLIYTKFVYNEALMLPEDDYYDAYSGKSKEVTDTIDGKVETYQDEFYRAASDKVYKINSSTYAFTETDLKNLKKLDLEILRNTIYARHGLTFKKKAYRQFFDYVSWYVPIADNVDAELTALEKENIKLFTKFEKYAVENYDTFGR